MIYGFSTLKTKTRKGSTLKRNKFLNPRVHGFRETKGQRVPDGRDQRELKRTESARDRKSEPEKSESRPKRAKKGQKRAKIPPNFPQNFF